MTNQQFEELNKNVKLLSKQITLLRDEMRLFFVLGAEDQVESRELQKLVKQLAIEMNKEVTND